MNIFRVLPLIVKYAPLVYSAVNIVEDLYGSTKSGPEKKELVMAWLSNTARQLALPWGDAAIGVVSNLIDTVVGIYNFIGLFRSRSSEGEEPAEVQAATVEVAAQTEATVKENVRKVTEQDPELAAFLEKMER